KDGLARGCLLRFLLAPRLSATVGAVIQEHLDREGSIVARSLLVRHAVLRLRPALRLYVLEEKALVIVPLMREILEIGLFKNIFLDKGTRSLLAQVQIDGADQRLEGIGKNRGILSSARLVHIVAEQDVGAESDLHGEFGQRLAIHDLGPQPRKKALVLLRKLEKKVFGRYVAQHGIPQELKPLVGEQVAVGLATKDGTVEQGLLVQANVADRPTDESLQVLPRHPRFGDTLAA